MASIAKRPDGQWRARYRDESGNEFAKHFSRKADAQAWLDSVTTAIGSGAYVNPKQGHETFAEFYADWSERQIWVPGTRRAMDLAARSTTFSGVALRNIRRSHIEQWVKAMTATLAPSTIRTRFNNVRAVLRAAVADRKIPVDPSVGVTIPRQRRAEMAMTIPTPQQVGTALDVADPQFETFVALCALPDNHPDSWLFQGSGEDPPHQNTVGHRWRSARQRAGLGDVRLHDLRHFFASGLIAAGCDVVTVQRAMGHSKATTTLRTYAHLWPTAEDRTRSAAEAIMTASRAPSESHPADSPRTGTVG